MIYQDLYKLHLLQILHKRENFRDACQEAGITQSAFSQQMTVLQKRFKATFYVKSKGRVSFTREGEELIQKAAPLLSDISIFEANIQTKVEDKKNIKEISMGSYESMAAILMPNLVATLQAQNKHFHLKLDTDRSSSLETRVQKGELDMALVVNPAKERSVKVEVLGESQLGLFVSSRHSIARIGLEQAMETYGLATLRADPVTGGRPSYYTKFMKTLPVNSRIVFSTGSFEVIRSMTMEGQIVGLLPTWVANKYAKELVCEWTGEAKAKGGHSLCLIYRESLEPVVAQTILTQLKRYFFDRV